MNKKDMFGLFRKHRKPKLQGSKRTPVGMLKVLLEQKFSNSGHVEMQIITNILSWFYEVPTRVNRSWTDSDNESHHLFSHILVPSRSNNFFCWHPDGMLSSRAKFADELILHNANTQIVIMLKRFPSNIWTARASEKADIVVTLINGSIWYKKHNKSKWSRLVQDATDVYCASFDKSGENIYFCKLNGYVCRFNLKSQLSEPVAKVPFIGVADLHWASDVLVVKSASRGLINIHLFSKRHSMRIHFAMPLHFCCYVETSSRAKLFGIITTTRRYMDVDVPEVGASSWLCGLYVEPMSSNHHRRRRFRKNRCSRRKRIVRLSYIDLNKSGWQIGQSLESKELVWKTTYREDDVMCASILDDRTIVTGHRSGVLRYWDFETSSLLKTLNLPNNEHHYDSVIDVIPQHRHIWVRRSNSVLCLS